MKTSLRQLLACLFPFVVSASGSLMCVLGVDKRLFLVTTGTGSISQDCLCLVAASGSCGWFLRYHTDLRAAPAEGLLSAVSFILGLHHRGGELSQGRAGPFLSFVWGFLLI